MKVKEESEKVSLKLTIQKTKIMASSPITSWHYRCGNNANSQRLYLGGSKITADDDCSHEIKTLAPGKKSYDKPIQHIKEQRYHFSDNVPYSQSYGFSSSFVWM